MTWGSALYIVLEIHKSGRVVLLHFGVLWLLWRFGLVVRLFLCSLYALAPVSLFSI